MDHGAARLREFWYLAEELRYAVGYLVNFVSSAIRGPINSSGASDRSRYLERMQSTKQMDSTDVRRRTFCRLFDGRASTVECLQHPGRSFGQLVKNSRDVLRGLDCVQSGQKRHPGRYRDRITSRTLE